MDGNSFGAWLDGIRDLTAEQRGQGFRALALAEAADGANLAPLPPPFGNSDFGLARTQDVPANAVPAGSAPEPVSLAAAAQSKVDLTGCPHCGGQRLQRWGHASGLQRHRCGDCHRSFNALTGTPWLVCA